jgi:Protein of unknown function (DUF935)
MASKDTSADVVEKPPESDIGIEFGVQLQGMPFSEEFVGPDNLLIRVSEPSVRQLVEMRRCDGQARALYRLLTMPVRMAAARASFLPEQGGEREAAFAEQLLRLPARSGGMRTPLHRVIGQMLLSVTDGFAAFELVYGSPKVGPLQGKWTLAKIAYRPSETVLFKVTDQGDYDGFQQRAMMPGGRYIDVHIKRNSSIYISCSEEENPMYGVSYFNAAYYHYDKKVKLYYLAHLAAQHRAVGSRLGKYPISATLKERRDFRTALANFGLGQAITAPSDGRWSVEDLGKSLGDFPFMDFINHHNSQMSKSVLAPFLDDDQGGRKSAVDFGGQTDSFYQTLVSVLIAEHEDVFNNWLIPRFIDWNFGSEKYPKIKFGAISDKQLQLVKDAFDKLSSVGAANATKPFLLELERTVAEDMGLEIDYEKFHKAIEENSDTVIEQYLKSPSTNSHPTSGAPRPAAIEPASEESPVE